MSSRSHSSVRFSIIIPTYNRPGPLAACLESLTQLAYPRTEFEVFVIDDGSVSDTERVVAPFRQRLPVTLLREQHVGPSGARNAGAARARGAYLAFTADDCTAAPSWLGELDAVLATQPDAAVGGSVRNGLPGNPYSSASQHLLDYLYTRFNTDPGRARFFTPNNLSVPARQYAALGGFDVAFVEASGEDRDFCDRWLARGFAMRSAPAAVVYHHHPLTLAGFWRLQMNYGRGSFRYHRQRAARMGSARWLEPPGFYLDLLGYPLRVGGGRRALASVGLVALAQIAIAAGFVSQRARLGPAKRGPGRTGGNPIEGVMDGGQAGF